MLEEHYFGNTLQAWITALGIAVVAFILLKLIRGVVVQRLSRLAESTRTKIDDLILDVLKGTRFFFLAMVSVYVGSSALTLSGTAAGVIQTLMILSMLLQAAVWGNRAVAFLIAMEIKRRMETDSATTTTLAALGFISKLILWSIVLLLALDNAGVDITGLVAGLGIGGIAVALALQNILGDLFASLSIVLDKPFVIGDFIVVDESLGSVEHIGLKTTRIRSLSGEQIVFSNADLLKSRIRNFKRMYERRVVFQLGVTYQTPHDTLARIGTMIKDIIEGQDTARFDRAHFKEYGPSSLNFEVVYYVQSPDFTTYMDIQQAINLEIYRRFEAEGIEFAYPTQTLYVQEERNGELTQARDVGDDRRLQ